MAGETIKTEAICPDIRPWSQTWSVWGQTPREVMKNDADGVVLAR